MSGFLKQLTMSGTEQAVVTDFDEARWEDVLEEAADEFLSTESSTLELVGVRLFIGESDVALLEFTQAWSGDL